MQRSAVCEIAVLVNSVIISCVKVKAPVHRISTMDRVVSMYGYCLHLVYMECNVNSGFTFDPNRILMGIKLMTLEMLAFDLQEITMHKNGFRQLLFPC